MRRDRLRPGGTPSLPEYFPGANERVTGIEIAAEDDTTSLVEDHTDPSFLETGRMKIVLPTAGDEEAGSADDDPARPEGDHPTGPDDDPAGRDGDDPTGPDDDGTSTPSA